MRTCHFALAMFLAAAASEADGQHTGLTHLGFLTCSLAAASDAQDANTPGPLRQTREMLCAFKPGEEGPEETYFGTFQSINQDQRDLVQRPVVRAGLVLGQDRGDEAVEAGGAFGDALEPLPDDALPADRG